MKQIAVLGCFAAFLCGCAAGEPVGLPPSAFGDAVRFNAAAQIVNPAAPEDRGPLTFNGERAALQQGRYLTDKVEKPSGTSTNQAFSDSANRGGNGGGGGGGEGNGGGM